MAKYFVMNLTEQDMMDRGLPLSEKRFEVQLLDANGCAKACGYVSSGESILTINGIDIPRAVLQAAQRQPVGQGEYVDDHGNPVMPF